MIEVKYLWTIAVGVFAYGLLMIVRLWWNSKALAAKTNVPEEPNRHWLWGNLANWPGNGEARLAYLRESIKKFPYWRTVWYGPFHNVVSAYHPKTIKSILQTTEPKPVMSASYYKFVKPWLGEGLVTSNGEVWARNRKLLTRAFHLDILKRYMQINNTCCDILLTKIAAVSDCKQTMDIIKHVNVCTLDVLLRCAMSYESRCQEEGIRHPYVKAVEELLTAVAHRVRKPLFYLDFIYNLSKEGRAFKINCDFVQDVADKVIQKRQHTLETSANVQQQKTRHLDFLDVLLSSKDDDGKGLTSKEIRDEVNTFTVAGYETTASAISWTLHTMAENPECQEKVQRELDEILGDRTEITWDDLPKLKYMTLCIKETLRLYTPIFGIQRQLTQTYRIHGIDVPAGNLFTLALYELHHNSSVWKDPMTFHPERMLPENMKDKDPFAFIPFSAGPRNCIGQQFAMHELKVIIGRMLHRYSVRLDPDRKTEKRTGIIIKTKDGMYLKFKTRAK